MININPAFSQIKERLKSKKSKGSVNNKSSVFESTLTSTIEAETENSIESLMNDLKDQEKKFLDAQSMHELLKYKKQVQKILDMIVKGGFQSQILTRRRRDRADYQIIKKIDENLLELSRQITSNNKSFNLLKQIDEIRGLIFDLVY